MLGSTSRRVLLLFMVLCIGFFMVVGCDPDPVKTDPTSYTLTMQMEGQGSVTPRVGSHSYDNGMVVNITATPADGWVFKAWAGEVADTGNAETTVFMDKDKTVNAVFELISTTQYTLTMQKTGNGTVQPVVGTHTYEQGTVVNISAQPAADMRFVHWEGPVANPNEAQTTVTMDDNKTVRAVFELISTTQYTLTMQKTGSGTVQPVVGTHTYGQGIVVNINAQPAADMRFVRWEGPVANPNVAQTTVTMDDNKTVRAVFGDSHDPGPQTSHTADGVDFHMRLAPAATFPTGMDNSGTSTVDTAFWVAETQVTYELWYTVRQWAERHGYLFVNAGQEGSNGSTGGFPSSKRNEPVIMVNWRDSIVWCNALSEMLGYDPVYTYQGSVIRSSANVTACDNAVQEDRDGFRLPTCNEWELAARYKGSDSSHGAISRGGLWWQPGNRASGAKGFSHEFVREVAWYWRNAKSTNDVGLKKANGLGAYDMSGNVHEWTFTRPRDREGWERIRGWGFNESYVGESLNNIAVSNLISWAVNYNTPTWPIGFRPVRTER